jgi:hypothetical protein
MKAAEKHGRAPLRRRRPTAGTQPGPTELGRDTAQLYPSGRAAARPYHASAYARPFDPFGMTSNSDLCAMGAAALPFRDSPGWWGETPSSP